MEGKDLYMLACRFPGKVIPEGLRAMAPKISCEETLGWVGEFWYYAAGSAVPRMYAKLHLPDGAVLEIKKLTGETAFPGGLSPKEPDKQWLEYLNRCVQLMENTEATEKDRSQLSVQWMNLLTAKEKMWFRVRQEQRHTQGKPASAPPEWLRDHWTAQRVHSTLKADPGHGENNWLLAGSDEKRVYFGKPFPAVKACIPSGLTPGLPKLSWEDPYGWTVEYRYYYAKSGIGFWLFPEPKFFLKLCLETGQLLEVKNLSEQLEFRQYRTEACTMWEEETALRYLEQCKKLMRSSAPEETELAQLEGAWLEAHPKHHGAWLAGNGCIGEAAARWLLNPGHIPHRELLLPLWVEEMVKGMTLGTPEVVEQCAGELAEFERYTVG